MLAAEAHGEPAEPSAETVKPNGHSADFTGLHVTWGAPIARYDYLDAAGELEFIVCRYRMPDDTDALCPWSFNGLAWVSRAPAAPRGVFGLELIVANPKASILIVDTEEIAQAVRRLLKPSANACVSWFGGQAGFGTTDWEPLAGRRVNICPSCAPEHWRCASTLAAFLYGLRCEVSVIDTHGKEAGWNLGRAIQQGMDLQQILEFAKKNRKPIQSTSQVMAMLDAPIRAGAAMPKPAEPPLLDELPSELTHSEIWDHYGLERVKGLPWPNLDNVTRILSRHPTLSTALWYDEFRCQTMVDDKIWDDEVQGHEITIWIQRAVKLGKVGRSVVCDAVRGYARTRGRHTIREHLDALKYDAFKRLDGWMTRALGVPLTEYSIAVGRIWLIGMAARVYSPGCILRTMVVLEGKQNIGKTTALSILGGEWHSEVTESMASKDFLQAMTGKWLVEVSELESFGKASIEAIKTTISRRSDYFRESYGRRTSEHPRQCVLVGTTNSDQWLSDDTGGTRFLPVRCSKIDFTWLRANRDQLLAEARDRFRAGEDWYTLPQEAAAAEVEDRYMADPWEQGVASWISGMPEVTVGELLSYLNVRVEDRTRQHSRRVGAILRHLGWGPRTARRDNMSVKVYTKASA